MPKYPYLPEGRILEHVPLEHPFMQAAKKAQEERAGDPFWPNGAVLVKDGKVVASAGNGFDRGSHLIHVCPRIVHECPSGEGYDLCSLHDPPGHAEQRVIKNARKAGIDPRGSHVYMFGHWWCCKPCWDEMIKEGIERVFLPEGADELFTFENVRAPRLQPTVKSAYIACGIKNVPPEAVASYHQALDVIGVVCESIGCTPYHPHKVSVPGLMENHNPRAVHDLGCEQVETHEIVIADATHVSAGLGGEVMLAKERGKSVVLVSKVGAVVSDFVKGNSAVVYHLEYDDDLKLFAKKLRNVLIQL